MNHSLDICGNITLDNERIAETIIENMIENGVFRLNVDPTKKCSYSLVPLTNDYNLKNIYNSGFYFIYRYEKLHWVGEGTRIRDRLTRFVKGANGALRHDENHAGATKWLNLYGRRNFEGFRFCYVDFPFVENVNQKVIEAHLITKLKPVLNVKVYW